MFLNIDKKKKEKKRKTISSIQMSDKSGYVRNTSPFISK